MIVIREGQTIDENALAATIGFFDGVHLGHRFLVEELRAEARKRNLPSAVITFAQHPRQVLHADYQPKLLTSFSEKIALLASLGVDYCIVLDFTVELSQLTAQQFISQILASRYHVRTLLIGYDHRFGHDRTDGFEQYVDYGAACGMEVLQASPYDAGRTPVSSSIIRRLLHDEGAVERAAELLTYPYSLRGHIVAGYQVGRRLGFPTANICVDEPFKVLPAIGVYAVRVSLLEKFYKGMLYIGRRPTVHNGDDLSIEVHILDFSGDIYQDTIRVSFLRRVRGDIAFDSLEALSAQLEKDREAVAEMI